MAIGMVMAVVVGSAELFVRLVIDDGMQYDLEMWKYARSVKQIAANPRVGHHHRPHSKAHLMGVDVEINRHRMRGNNIAQQPASGVTRIMMLGDSLTFGWGVLNDETVSRRVEKILQEKGYNVEVINAGVGNYNTDMEVEYFLTEGLSLSPNLIVLNYFVNDAEQTPTYAVVGAISSNSYAWTYFGSRFDVLLRQLEGKKDWAEYYLDLYEDQNAGKSAAAIAIDRLADFCRANAIDLLIVNYPELRDLKNYRFGIVQEFVRSAAAKNSVGYLDLFDSVHQENEASLWVTSEDPHPNGRANEFFANAISEELARDFLRRRSGKIGRVASRQRPECCADHQLEPEGPTRSGNLLIAE